MRSETVANGLTATPSLTAILMWLVGKDINFWVGVAGFFFIMLQAAYLVWKWRRDIRREQTRVGLSDDE